MAAGPASASPGPPGIDAIGIVASDLARSVRFYAALGVELPDFDGELGDHVEAVLAGGIRLMLDRESLIRSLDPAWRPGGPGRVALAVGCGTPAGVDALYQRLAADGYGSHEPWDAPWGQRYASVHDPDGTAVDLYAWLPGQPAS